jgi:DNA (cytosine-5)-methyltransferase 1
MGLDDVLSNLEAIDYTWWTFVIPAVALDAKHRRDRLWIVGYSSSTGRRDITGAREEIDLDGDLLAQARWTQGTNPAERSSEVLAHTPGERCREARSSGSGRSERVACPGATPNNVADSDSDSGKRLKHCISDEKRRPFESERQTGSCSDGVRWWEPEPSVGRVADGIPSRAHRLRALGNAVVPQIPEMIGYAILEAEREFN